MTPDSVRVLRKPQTLIDGKCIFTRAGCAIPHESLEDETLEVLQGSVRVHFRCGYEDAAEGSPMALPKGRCHVIEAKEDETRFTIRPGSFTPALSILNAGAELPAGFSHGDTIGPDRRAHALLDAQTQLPLQPPGSVREQLYRLQSALGNLPEVEFPLQHTFAPGVYARTIKIPAGSVLVGKIHKHKHLNILSEGEVRVLTESAGVETLRGPLTMVSEPGTKRAVFAVTDATWTTIHLTSETDLAKIEAEVIAPTYEAYEQFLQGNAL